jgi:hypothetical protein
MKQGIQLNGRTQGDLSFYSLDTYGGLLASGSPTRLF